LLLVGGGLSFIAIFSIDLVAIARESGVLSIFTADSIERLRGPLGIGPAQRLALFVCLGLAAIGGTLIPLGDKPA
jgi:hypothetical protein